MWPAEGGQFGDPAFVSGRLALQSMSDDLMHGTPAKAN